jgi:hypothetical protein
MSTRADASSGGLWIGLILGGPVIAFGIAGAVNDADRTHPAELARWVLGAALAHDLVFAPLVLASGWTLARIKRGRRPRSVHWALATSVVLALFAWPFVRGYGRSATVPSLLPRNYGRGLLAYIAAVWLVAVAMALGAHVRQRRR